MKAGGFFYGIFYVNAEGWSLNGLFSCSLGVASLWSAGQGHMLCGRGMPGSDGGKNAMLRYQAC